MPRELRPSPSPPGDFDSDRIFQIEPLFGALLNDIWPQGVSSFSGLPAADVLPPASGDRNATRAGQVRCPWSPHTLCWRGKSSANCAMVLLVLPPEDHLWIGGNRGNARDLSEADRWPQHAHQPGPSCISPAPQLTREWSLWPEFGRIPGNLCHLSKG
jgi:hypothetical protein